LSFTHFSFLVNQIGFLGGFFTKKVIIEQNIPNNDFPFQQLL